MKSAFIVPVVMLILLLGCAQQTPPSNPAANQPPAPGASQPAPPAMNVTGPSNGSATVNNTGTTTNGSASANETANSSRTIVTAQVVVQRGQDPVYGQILTDIDGMALYVSNQDKLNSSSCAGACATMWPPLLLPPGESLSSGISGIGTIERQDGTTQVTYNGMPLYTYSGDAPDEVTGNSYEATWFVAKPGMTTFPKVPR